MQYYFSTDANDPIIVENSRDYSCPASTLPWIIAGSLVGAILLLGLLALIILKICLVFLVSSVISVWTCLRRIEGVWWEEMELRAREREREREGGARET